MSSDGGSADRQKPRDGPSWRPGDDHGLLAVTKPTDRTLIDRGQYEAEYSEVGDAVPHDPAFPRFCRLDEAVESRETTLVSMILPQRLLTRREIDGLNAKSPQRRAGEAHRKLLCRRVGPGALWPIGRRVGRRVSGVLLPSGVYGFLTPSARAYTPP